MIFELLPEGDPFLRQRVPQFMFEDPMYDPVQIAADLVETMNHHKAFGLAANQCGIGVRAFVLQPLGEGDKPIVCFNPVVLQESENLVLRDEGCLSFPDLSLNIKRPIIVTVQYWNEKCELIETVFANLHARGFLHETEHLNGVLFTDNVSKLKLDLANKKRAKFAKRA